MLVVSLWTLLILARPLAGWKIALVATMTGTEVLIVSFPPLGHSTFLLDPSPLCLLIAGVVGVAAATVVDLAQRAITVGVVQDDLGSPTQREGAIRP